MLRAVDFMRSTSESLFERGGSQIEYRNDDVSLGGKGSLLCASVTGPFDPAATL
jgi:hypothetical protein